jgi:hypothetical protein
VAEQRVVIPYEPRPEQRAIHAALDKHRFAVVVCHRRFGKTVLAINELIKRAMTCTRERPRVAYIAPTYRQAKLISWDYAKDFTRVIPGVTFNEAELRIDFPGGARLQLLGADNADSLRGIYLDAVVLDEYALMSPRVWSEIVRPTLADRLGRSLFIGTPMGDNSFRQIYDQATQDDEWFSVIRRASETGIVDAAELKRAAATMSPEQYAQEFECSWSAAVPGAYYGRLMDEAERDGRIGRVPYDSHAKTYTAWDLGIGDSTAIWVLQPVAKELHAIAYYETNGQPLAHFVAWLKDLGYPYQEHYLPHDAAARELQTGKSRVEALLQLGIRATVLPASKVDDGIEEVRRLIPMTWFDAIGCKEGVNALRNYRSEYDDRRRALRRQPLHDWASHGADAFRQYAMHRPRTAKREPIEYPKLGIV